MIGSAGGSVHSVAQSAQSNYGETPQDLGIQEQ